MLGLQTNGRCLITSDGKAHVLSPDENFGDIIEGLAPVEAAERVGHEEADLVGYAMSRGWIVVEDHGEATTIMTDRWPSEAALHCLRLLLDPQRTLYVRLPGRARPYRTTAVDAIYQLSGQRDD